MENICFANNTEIKFVFNHVDAILAGKCNKSKSIAYGKNLLMEAIAIPSIFLLKISKRVKALLLVIVA